MVEAYKAIQVEVDVVEPGGAAETDPAKMDVADLRDWLTAQGIEFDPKAPKAEIMKLIPAS
ncbi:MULTISPECIES: hypothetical protein [unclassified Pseudomonas]|uniref:hypothetical protein n=1 Tax=unclassified Pseudomonas TaxID=196821 RepID=UPI00211568C0|nr:MULTISPECIES: hypothetical protein [unclassified Pseudomonas]